MNPSSALIIVLLPAPFGPEQADGAGRERGRHVAQRRVASPYVTVTLSSVTTGVGFSHSI